MSNDKMFKVTGVSRCNDTFKVRFANDMSRVKVLLKTGHDEIELVEMPEATDKAGCVRFLKGSELYKRDEYRQAIDAADVKYNGEPVVKVKAERVARPAKAKPSMDAIRTRASQVKAEQTADTEPAAV